MVFGVGQFNGVILNFPPANPRCHGNEFWDKIGYNSAPVKDNCALFAPTPYFRGRAIWCHLNFSPGDPCCHGNKFWDKIYCNSVCVKDICKIFASITGFRGWAIECCQLHFSPIDPSCHGNEIWNKMGDNSACVKKYDVARPTLLNMLNCSFVGVIRPILFYRGIGQTPCSYEHYLVR